MAHGLDFVEERRANEAACVMNGENVCSPRQLIEIIYANVAAAGDATQADRSKQGDERIDTVRESVGRA
jgi:hypothetical protein